MIGIVLCLIGGLFLILGIDATYTPINAYYSIPAERRVSEDAMIPYVALGLAPAFFGSVLIWGGIYIERSQAQQRKWDEEERKRKDDSLRAGWEEDKDGR